MFGGFVLGCMAAMILGLAMLIFRQSGEERRA
jgi:hypothetical protein